MNEEERMIKRQDCIAIAKDKNFQELASDFKQDFDSRYESFIKLSNVKQMLDIHLIQKQFRIHNNK